MNHEEKIAFIHRQTNLTIEEIETKLEEHNGDFMEVIRGHYRRNRKEDPKKYEPIVSVNQEIYKQLRYEMSQLQKLLDANKKSV